MSNNNNKCKRIAGISKKKKRCRKEDRTQRKAQVWLVEGDGKRGPGSQESRMTEEQGQVSRHLKKNAVDLELIISGLNDGNMSFIMPFALLLHA